MTTNETAAKKGPWTCFFCDETFTTDADARLHFGAGEECEPACRIKASEKGLVGVLRETEEALFGATCALHEESAEALKAWQAAGRRHSAALEAMEQLGYERGLRDYAASIARLRRIVARYGDRIAMANCHRSDWQIEIDEAIRFANDNPE